MDISLLSRIYIIMICNPWNSLCYKCDVAQSSRLLECSVELSTHFEVQHLVVHLQKGFLKLLVTPLGMPPECSIHGKMPKMTAPFYQKTFQYLADANSCICINCKHF